jgi:hypothetical protein
MSGTNVVVAGTEKIGTADVAKFAEALAVCAQP